MDEHYYERQERSCTLFPCEAEVFEIGEVNIARMFEIKNLHLVSFLATFRLFQSRSRHLLTL